MTDLYEYGDGGVCHGCGGDQGSCQECDRCFTCEDSDAECDGCNTLCLACCGSKELLPVEDDQGVQRWVGNACKSRVKAVVK